MVHSNARIAIIGGGMGGLTAAIALRKIAGVQATVFEQAGQLGEVGAGVTVAPNAARVLDRLGVLERIRSVGAVPDGHGVYQDAQGRMVTDAAWEDTAKEYQNIGMYRPDLIDALAAEVDPAAVRLGHRLTAVEETDDGVRVEFENGGAEVFDAVIGADGIHSVVRAAVGQHPEPVYSGYIVYRGVVDASRLPEDWPMISQVWMGDSRHFMCYPLQQRRLFNFVAGIPSDRPLHGPWSGPAEVAELAAEFAGDGWDPRLQHFIAQVDKTFWWGLFDHDPLTNWSRGPITLLGDAAHTMLPHQGQGVNQAIEDSMALATFLAAADEVSDIPEAFRRYTAVRMQRTAILQNGSRRAGAMFDAQYEFADLAKRDADIRVGRDFRRGAVFDYDAQKVAERALARFRKERVA
ncbi:FAD-dependent monooxygenase [Streptomyces sp. AC495_CC817]|uniref:FAD-dependent monooxygenase n=1 Tax=Streptomyces sp. AC495_CC817 TaxID=2823900 RepID=UPI001C27BF71|nr:FAD-dependent monooxygenase [Streptomyces sp. AC495_CC817]